jgi:hypothetical protein
MTLPAPLPEKGTPWRNGPSEQVGTCPKIRRRLPEQRLPAAAARRVVAADDYEETRALLAVIRGSAALSSQRASPAGAPT